MTLILNPRPADIQTEGKTDITSRQRKQKDGQSETGKAGRQTDRQDGRHGDRQAGRQGGRLPCWHLLEICNAIRDPLQRHRNCVQLAAGSCKKRETIQRCSISYSIPLHIIIEIRKEYDAVFFLARRK